MATTKLLVPAAVLLVALAASLVRGQKGLTRSEKGMLTALRKEIGSIENDMEARACSVDSWDDHPTGHDGFTAIFAAYTARRDALLIQQSDCVASGSTPSPDDSATSADSESATSADSESATSADSDSATHR